MTTYAAPVNVKNSMLLSLGAKPITPGVNTSKEAIILDQIYEPMVKAALTRHAWTWGVKSQAVQSSGQANNGNYLYPVPSSFLNVRWVRCGGSDVQVEYLEDGELALPFGGEIEVHGNWRVPEARWPADFAEAIVKKGYASLIRSLMNDFTEAGRAEQEAEMMLRRSIARDKRQIRGRDINQNPILVQAWRGRRRNGSKTVLPE